MNAEWSQGLIVFSGVIIFAALAIVHSILHKLAELATDAWAGRNARTPDGRVKALRIVNRKPISRRADRWE